MVSDENGILDGYLKEWESCRFLSQRLKRKQLSCTSNELNVILYLFICTFTHVIVRTFAAHWLLLCTLLNHEITPVLQVHQPWFRPLSQTCYVDLNLQAVFFLSFLPLNCCAFEKSTVSKAPIFCNFPENSKSSKEATVLLNKNLLSILLLFTLSTFFERNASTSIRDCLTGSEMVPKLLSYWQWDGAKLHQLVP